MGFLGKLLGAATTAGGGAIIGGAITGIASIFAGGAKKNEAYRARVERDKLKGELSVLEKNRQTIINPYANVTDISEMAKDLSGMVSNPFANLGVATQAAEMQIEEADIALANTLDTLRATGASAGGATALAQAALQSKKGVSAGIEKQEVANEKLKAQGQQQLEKLQMSEAQRIQTIGMSEAQRLQQADIAGQTFEFNQKETRQMGELNRKQAQITGQAQAAVAADSGADAIYASGLGALGTIASAYAGNSGIAEVKKDPSGGGGGGENTDSDRRLKKNIKLIGKSPKGLNIYAFEYINKAVEKVYQGVMSDEIPQHAVTRYKDGFDRVDYSKIDVTFKQI